MAAENKIVREYDDGTLVCCDAFQFMRSLPDNAVDLVLGSPPYEDARTYGIDFCLKGQDWVNWMVKLWTEMDRVSKGVVAMVVEGRTEGFQWTATPALLMADLHRAGFKLRKPPLYVRDGTPGGGGPDWFQNKYEFIVCTSKGRLPWSDNTACGHPPLFKRGGPMSNRKEDGKRAAGGYDKLPALANPGNLIDCGAVGGGRMGSKFAHEGEAPFPEKIADFFIRSCCPKEGVVFDPFSGSGTTVAVARKLHRSFIGVDIRQSQIEIADKRLEEARLQAGFDI